MDLRRAWVQGVLAGRGLNSVSLGVAVTAAAAQRLDVAGAVVPAMAADVEGGATRRCGAP